MKTYEILEVVRKLVGHIDPVGESYVDGQRLENIHVLTEVIDRLLGDVMRVSVHRHRHEASMKRIGDHAYEFLNDIRGAVND